MAQNSSSLSPAQSKQGRALLRWSQADLAGKANMSAATVGKFERGGSTRASSIAALSSALQSAGVFLLADDVILASAPITLETYVRAGHARYRKLAERVADMLAKAIVARGGMRLLMTPWREKEPGSLRKKLVDRGIAEAADLAITLKDLAGAQLVFLSDTDVTRFMQSRLLVELFDIDFDRTRIHYADQRATDSGRQFTANHYVVRLRPEKAALPENADIAGLWCEVQVYSVLQFAWSKMSHDITYKAPKLSGIGEELMKDIDARMTHIMQDYILPTGFEFQKVERDFEQLLAGQALLDAHILDEIATAPNNNKRSDLLDTFREHLLPQIAPKIVDWYADIRKSMLAAANAARTAPQTPYTVTLEDGSEMPIADGEEPEAVIKKVIDILTDGRVRYVDVGATFDALAEMYLNAVNDEERALVMKAHEPLAAYDLTVWRQAGPVVQVMLLHRINKLTAGERAALGPFITDIYGQFLEPDMDGISSTSETVTWAKAPMQAAPAVRRIRDAAIDGLFEQFREARDIGDKRNIVSAIDNATRTPSYGDYDKFLVAVLEDSRRVAEFYRANLDHFGGELKVKVENDMLLLHRRYRDYEFKGDLAGQQDGARNALLTELQLFRAAINADADFVLCKSLVGHDTVLPHEWDEPEDHYDFQGRRAYHAARADEYAEQVTARTAGRWLNIAECCAEMHGGETGGMDRFMRRAGETRPKIARDWLEPMSVSPASGFVRPLLEGLSISRPQWVDAFIEETLSRGRNLRPILSYFHTHEPLNLALVDRTTEAALAGDDNFSVYLAFALAIERADALGPERARSLYLSGLDQHVRRPIANWPSVASRWKDNTLFDALTNDDLRLVLGALETVPAIDHYGERMLIDIAARMPGEVVALFGRRQKIEDEARAEGLRRRSYDAIPFQFGKLAAALAPHLEEVVGQAWAWTEADPRLAEFKGAAFVANVYKQWSPAIREALRALFQSGEDPKRDFVFAVLKRYNNDPAIHDLLRDIVAVIGNDEERQDDVEAVLEQTGVMWGEFGTANAYRGKNKLLEPWAQDERASVQSFAKKMKQKFDNAAAAEQRRSEQDLAARRLDFDEAPKRGDDKDKITDDDGAQTGRD